MCSSSTSPRRRTSPDGVRDLDFGLAVCGGLDFALSGGTLAVDVRYVLPLSRWSDYVENEDPVFN